MTPWRAPWCWTLRGPLSGSPNCSASAPTCWPPGCAKGRFHDRGQFGAYIDLNCPRSWCRPLGGGEWGCGPTGCGGRVTGGVGAGGGGGRGGGGRGRGGKHGSFGQIFKMGITGGALGSGT